MSFKARARGDRDSGHQRCSGQKGDEGELFVFSQLKVRHHPDMGLPALRDSVKSIDRITSTQLNPLAYDRSDERLSPTGEEI